MLVISSDSQCGFTWRDNVVGSCGTDLRMRQRLLMRAELLMEPAPCLLLLLLWGYCLAVIDGEGELRCYCNESGCVSTGYMCKSPAGHCYTAVEVQGENTRATHGCLDSIPADQRGLCGLRNAGKNTQSGPEGKRPDRAREGADEEGGRSSSDSAVSVFPLLICCDQDMCNYIENIDFSSIATLTRANGTLHTGAGGSERDVTYSKNGEREGDDRDLWFKAAVIAVPIAGGFILVLLVLLAVRMLRTDTQRHRRLVQVRRERSLTKAQLYVTDHFSDGGGKMDPSKGCLLYPPNSHAESGVSGGCGHGPGGDVGVVGGGKVGNVKMGTGISGGSGKPVCRDVNISVDREGRVYEQVQCDVNVHRHSHLPSVVTWGRPPKADLAAMV